MPGPAINNPISVLLSSKSVQINRAGAAATGNVAYTGVGFRPRALIAFARTPTGAAVNNQRSIGFCDVALASKCLYWTQLDLTCSLDNTLITISDEPASTNSQTCVVASLDADGFTLTWTKAGAGSSYAADVIILCLA